ncbi:DUF402 domain-containing protein [Paenibacillus glycanilyticus]|uniref:DUF402 domain-containing protein n=1 Tax=Paenibacillus glycanilyticus TaxID=126569 RepID=A0ABQ6GMD2_9BACL|nr:DUF402 domain-containing protein [Paenibacillus glycanilyticus]GLX70496.1 hypothetical protein MU1_48420 [Paenibacillus glycanilyticus]
MKRKYGDLSHWRGIIQKKYRQMYIEEVGFTGHVTLVVFNKVKESISFKLADQDDFYIVADGFMWLQYFPSNAHHTMTAVINEKGKIVQWYFDITLANALTIEGVPYFDDLFLDVVVLPNKEIFVLDEDELLEALNNETISINDYKLARKELDLIYASLTDGSNELIKRWDTDLKSISSEI